MAEDWAIDVKKYAPDADDAVIAAIVRHCGISLKDRDSSLVAFTDPAETGRIRDNYCRTKLGLTDPDATIDSAISRVGERMSGDRTRNRVTVYYLLAEHFGKLGLFGGAGATAAAAPAATMAAGAGMLGASSAVARNGGSAPVRGHAVSGRRDDAGIGAGFALAVLGGLAVIIVGTATLGSQIGSQGASSVPVTRVAPADFSAPVAAPAATAAVAVPDGAGAVAKDVAGKPVVSVYFDTGKADVTPDFATVAAPVKAWIDGHPGDRLAVSGFNDARGNAALNAELSKNRAQAVAAALAAIGVPAGAIDLVKPPETTDTDADMSNARRVDIVVTDGG